MFTPPSSFLLYPRVSKHEEEQKGGIASHTCSVAVILKLCRGTTLKGQGTVRPGAYV